MAQPFKKQIVRYYTPDGDRCGPDAPGAVRTVELSSKWYGTVGGKAVPLCRDKGASQKLLNKLLTDATMKQHGMADYGPHLKRPLAEHLKDFQAYLVGKGDDMRHVAVVTSRLDAIPLNST
jgi:hypothetical protein